METNASNSGATTEPRDLLDEGIRFERAGVLNKALDRYRAAAEAGDPAIAAEALRRQSDVYRTQSDWERASLAARASAEIAKGANLVDAWSEALNAEAGVHMGRGEFDEAKRLLLQILDLGGDERIRGIALQNLGSIAAQQGDRESAEKHLLESYKCFRRCGYERGKAIALTNFAAIALDQHEFELAYSSSDQAMASARRVEDLDLLAIATLNFAEALAGLGDHGKAEEFASAALGYFGVTENKSRRVESLRYLGDLARAQGHTTAARRYYEAALQLARKIGAQAEVTRNEERLGRLTGA